VTNKLKLNQLTATMVDKLTSIVKNPLEADADKTFDEPKIASAWNGGSSQQPHKVYWAEVVGPEPVNNGNARLQEPSEMLKDRLKKPVASKYASNKPKPDTKQAKVQKQN